MSEPNWVDLVMVALEQPVVRSHETLQERRLEYFDRIYQHELKGIQCATEFVKRVVDLSDENRERLLNFLGNTRAELDAITPDNMEPDFQAADPSCYVGAAVSCVYEEILERFESSELNDLFHEVYYKWHPETFLERSRE